MNVESIVVVAAIVVGGLIIGLLTNWLGRPPWLKTRWIIIVLTVAVVAVGIGTYITNANSTPVSALPGVTPGVSAPTATVVTGSTTPPVVPPASTSGSYLDRVTPDTGGTNIGTLPKALRSSPAYAHSLTIHCPTNQTVDTLRDVTYQLDGQYQRFQASVFAFDTTSSRVLIGADIYLDNQKPMETHLMVGASGTIDIDVTDVKMMVIRVTCRTTTGSAVLGNPFLTYESN